MKKLLIPSIFFLFIASGAQAQCKAYFKAATDTTLIAHFYDSSNISGTSHKYYSWDFGDGGKDTVKNPTHTYTSAGFYDVYEYIIDSSIKCASFYHRKISVGPRSLLCLAFFIPLTDSSLTARFYDSSTIGGRSREHYKYTFGDGHSDTTSKNVTYTYATAGTYTVCEYIYDSAGTCSSNYCKTITVTYKPCHAFFMVNTDTTLTAHFYDSSYMSSGVASYIWYFGDGDSSIAKNPSHTYALSGTYTVCEYIYDSISLCSSHYCKTITAGNTSCHAYFTSSTDTTLTAHFTDSSTLIGKPHEYYYWNFGDTTSITGKTPSHTYKRAGTYTVCEQIVDSAKACISNYCKTISVGHSSRSCHAYFLATTDTSNIASFTDSSYTTALHPMYKWYFGDGDSSTTKDPSHTYTTAGTYTVCEYIFDTIKFCSSHYCKTIKVGHSSGSGCSAFFGKYSDTSLSASFFDSSYITAIHPMYKWYFGDGDSSTSKNPTHTYTLPGWYYVCEFITDSAKSCSSSYCDSIHVGTVIKPCKAYFTVDSIDSAKKILYITNRSTGALSYLWDFGDGDTSVSAKPLYTYGSPGVYNLCLYILCGGTSYSVYCDTIKGAATHITRSGSGYTIKVADATGIKEASAVSTYLKVYPNPVTNTLNIYLPDNVTNGVLSVRNVLGQNIRTDNVSTAHTILDMSTIPSGVYLIQLQTNQGMFVTRILKQ